MSYENIRVETFERVGLIRLHRPDVLNALNKQLMKELGEALEKFEHDSGIGCLVLTGSPKVFAAGADVHELSTKTYIESYLENFLSSWEKLARLRKPIIAAVSGFALGGGCELALMCDFILASETAQFGQPEVKIGILPGAGGTQRLTRALGKAKAMELCLTGRRLSAQEAEKAGLVVRVVPVDALELEALETARLIASHSLPITMMIKESIQRAEETSLEEGLRFERRLFHSAFATHDQKEGMKAFLEKRAPHFLHR